MAASNRTKAVAGPESGLLAHDPEKPNDLGFVGAVGGVGCRVRLVLLPRSNYCRRRRATRVANFAGAAEDLCRRAGVPIFRRSPPGRRVGAIVVHASDGRGNPAWSMDGIATAFFRPDHRPALCGDHAADLYLPD